MCDIQLYDQSTLYSLPQVLEFEVARDVARCYLLHYAPTDGPPPDWWFKGLSEWMAVQVYAPPPSALPKLRQQCQDNYNRTLTGASDEALYFWEFMLGERLPATLSGSLPASLPDIETVGLPSLQQGEGIQISAVDFEDNGVLAGVSTSAGALASCIIGTWNISLPPIGPWQRIQPAGGTYQFTFNPDGTYRQQMQDYKLTIAGSAGSSVTNLVVTGTYEVRADPDVANRYDPTQWTLRSTWRKRDHYAG